MTRNWTFLLTTLALAAIGSITAGAAERPNILLIMADDMGAGELGCYGHKTQRTPNLDKLAETGTAFRTAYACPICHPTRFLIMTGQYGCHNGVYQFPGRLGGPPVADEGVDDITQHLTFGQVLKQAGYDTAMSGKWQLSGKPGSLIKEVGFDEHRVWAYQNYYTPQERAKAEAAGIVFRSRYWKPSILTNGVWLPTTTEDHGEDLFAQFICDFIRRHQKERFFAYYPMVLTHGPHHATPDTAKSEADKVGAGDRHYSANVEYLDKVVGRVMGVLDELGLRENTIVIFTTDNGTAKPGSKGSGTELGARVPLIVNCPGRVKARGMTDELADLSDIFPTLLEYAGVPLPTDRPIDGKSLVSFVEGRSDATRDWIFSYIGDRRILRTKRWLLENNTPKEYGRLFDCGDSRDGSGYKEVTSSKDSDVIAVRRQFDELLAKLPAPNVEGDERKDKRDRDQKRKNRRKLAADASQ